MIHEKKFFSKKNDRKVTSFIGQELLYDYMSGKLDAERIKAVEEYLQQNRESLNDVNKIQVGLDYTDLMSQTKVSDALLQKIQVPDSYVENVVNKLKIEQWPAPVKMGVEASLIVIAITVIAVLIPWNKIRSDSHQANNVTLTEINKSPSPSVGGDNPPVEAKRQDGEVQFQDEGTGKADKTAAASKNNENSAAKSVTKPDEPTKTVAVNKPEESKPSNTPTATAPTATASASAAAIKTEAATESSENKKALAGFIYRGAIKITNAKAARSKLVDGVSALGGRKAGNVELGWEKGNGLYFHFTMPESKYQDLITLFKEYGELRISKEKHDRVMPDGIIRLIIEVEEE